MVKSAFFTEMEQKHKNLQRTLLLFTNWNRFSLKSNKFIFILNLLLFFTFETAQGQETKIEVEPQVTLEFRPVKIHILITHLENEKVDIKSFKLENTPQTVEFLQEKSIPNTTDEKWIVSSYVLFLPSQPKGIYFLGPISVKVGEKTLQSSGMGYEVVSSPEDKFLFLEFIISPENRLFPGQELKLGYRISYKGSIALSVEQLPLLDAEGFQKLGGKEIKEFQKGGLNTQEITQTVRALKPNEYLFPPSIIVGNLYDIVKEAGSKKMVIKDQLKAELPAKTIIVNSFPSSGMPLSFNGALGQFTWLVTNRTDTTMRVGDKIILDVEFNGKGEFATINFPEITCQPGFSGFFDVPDWPSGGLFTGYSKKYRLELSPMVPFITQVPSMTFSYFNPETEQYGVLTSKPIPIQVTAASIEENIKQDDVKFKEIKEGFYNWREMLNTKH